MAASYSNKEKNISFAKENFSISHDVLPFAYISSVPSGLNLITTWESRKGRVKGCSSGFIFYENNYSCITAHFNLNDSKIDYNTFLLRIETMLATLQYLNNGKTITAFNTYLILKHVQNFGNYNFDLKEVYSKIKKIQYNHEIVKIKTRDYKTIQEELMLFKKPIEFINALNKARKIVNCNFNLSELFYLIEERIANDDYGYIYDTQIIGHKDHNKLIRAIIRKFNILCTGKQRTGNLRNALKSESLYNSINTITLKAMSLKPQLQNAFIKKTITSYEKELKRVNQLVENRLIAHQLLFILSELTGLDHELNIILNTQIRDELKAEFVNTINNKGNLNSVVGAKEFDLIYKIPHRNRLPTITDLSNIFSDDYSNSIFNHTTLEDAKSKGKVFLTEYNKFHKIHGRNIKKIEEIYSNKLMLTSFPFS